MENTERFEQLLRKQSYQALSMEDRKWVAEFVASEEEYEALRQITQQLEKHITTVDLSPNPDILKSLKKSWDEKRHAIPTGIRSAWSVPAYAAVVAVLVFGAAGWWAGLSWGTKTIYIDRLVNRVDTVQVVSKPDTVVIERVVYQRVITATVKPVTVSPHRLNRGVNMKEKEELEKLLVSGGL